MKSCPDCVEVKARYKDNPAYELVDIGQQARSLKEFLVLRDNHPAFAKVRERGKIVSLGRTVGIELEDGLVIQAAYGEFAVTHTDEITALKQSKVKLKKTVTSQKPTHSKPNSNAIEVDLHIEALPGGRNIQKGQQFDFQMETFRRVIRENAPHRGRTITFIHGVGDGILKAAIRKELDEVLALRCSYSVGDPAVTVVTIK